MDLQHPDLEFVPNDDILAIRFTSHKFDSSNLDTISECMSKLISESDYQKYVLNLKKVSFIYSDAIGQMVAFQTNSEAAGGAIRFCEINQDIAKTLEVLKLLDHLHIAQDEATAIAELS